VLATGLSVACVYTRYHHAVDVIAGLSVAIVAALIGFGLTRKSPHRMWWEPHHPLEAPGAVFKRDRD